MPKPAAGPSNEVLYGLLEYDPETGVFTRCRDSGGPGRKGDVVGTVRPDGYLKVCLSRKCYLLHRLAFQYMTGKAPKGYIDHINGDQRDNRWANLREVSPLLSSQNKRKARKGSASRFLGVSRRTDSGKWTAQIGHNYRCYNLGVFDTEEAAYETYLSAKRRLHEGCTI